MGAGFGRASAVQSEVEQWTVYELPDAENQIPYALNVDERNRLDLWNTQ